MHHLVAAEAEDLGPALFVIESGADGLEIEDEPAMGLRPAATGRLLLKDVKLPEAALLGGHGFVKEHPVERWYRDLRAAGVMEGALLV